MVLKPEDTVFARIRLLADTVFARIRLLSDTVFARISLLVSADHGWSSVPVAHENTVFARITLLADTVFARINLLAGWREGTRQAPAGALVALIKCYIF